MNSLNEKSNFKTGIFCIAAANVLWGVLPVYWKIIKTISAPVILLYRIVLMFVFCLAVSLIMYGPKEIIRNLFESKKKFFTYMAAGIVIAFNWGVYVWAVNSDYVIQTCIGYFIEPLVTCLFGMIFYKEKANKWKKSSLVMAAIGLLVTIIGYRELPVIALALGVAFACYSAIKKSITVPPFLSLLYETLFTAPFALIILLHLEHTGAGAFASADGVQLFALMLAGIATAAPMALFAAAARKLPLITVGISDYISPTISLILGIFLFREPFDIIQFSSFCVIWVGLGLFTYGEYTEQKISSEIHK